MIDFKEEKISDIWEELYPLLELHWNELEDPSIEEHPAPKLDSYDQLEVKGLFSICTARHLKKLVGYCGFYLYPHMHYPSKIYAMNDVLLLLPEYRKTTAGVKLMKFSEQVVRERGAICVLWSVREWRDFSPILTRMGYHKQETVYMKNFG